MKYIFLISFWLFASCKKELSCDSCIPGTTNTSNAIVAFTGPVEGDGCSWTIVIDNVHYHPDMLSADFQHDQLNVNVTYELTKGFFGCGIANTKLTVIHIISIKPG